MPGPYRGLIHQYREFMPLEPEVEPVTSNEGATPLLRLSNLERELETPVELYAKFEGTNPTGSFKDRGMTVAVTHAVSEGAKAIICASTGNTSASAAAYAARAGVRAGPYPGGRSRALRRPNETEKDPGGPSPWPSSKAYLQVRDRLDEEWGSDG